ACQLDVKAETSCASACESIGSPISESQNNDQRTCLCVNMQPNIDTVMESHYKKLIAKIKGQADPSSAPYYTYQNNPPHKIHLA
ncbi:hypothetical protein PFISCL1PPCAC_4935, partial [Pristionchus fissidentatus]